MKRDMQYLWRIPDESLIVRSARDRGLGCVSQFSIIEGPWRHVAMADRDTM